MKMREQLFVTVENLLAVDERLVLLLGDIGVYGFRKAFERFPSRVYNIGILEQSTVGLAAGLSMTGLVPIVHTIAPFLVERCIEQLKDDFCYQQLGGNFISVGASYDYAALGCTHHCPADVPLLRNLPGMEIVVPGTSGEFDLLLRQSCFNGRPTYFRLSERQNQAGFETVFGRAVVVQRGKDATVVVVGTVLSSALEAISGLDVTVIYYTCVRPFDSETLRHNCPSGKVLLCEPYYGGALAQDVMQALSPKPIRLETVGVPIQFLEHYGTAKEHDEAIGFTPANMRKKLLGLIRN